MKKTKNVCKHADVTLWLEVKAEKLGHGERLVFAGCLDCEKKKKITETFIRKILNDGI